MANRQAVLVEESKPLEIQDNPIPEAPPGGLVVKTHFCGICHSDVHFWDNKLLVAEGMYMKLTDNPGYDFPIVMGHETAGEVYSIGKDQPAGAPKLSIGDKVLVYPWCGCLKCGACKIDKSTLCAEQIRYNIGLGANGGYGSYVPVSDSSFAVKAPDDLPLDVGAMLCCSGLTAYNALCHAKPYLDTADKMYGSSTLLIVGAGGLGLWAVELAKGALRDNKTKVVVADIGEAKLETAKAAGADVTVLWDSEVSEQDLVKRTKEACGGGFDASIDFVSTSVTTGRTSQCCNKGATNVLVGLFGGTLSVPLIQFPSLSISYHGIMTGSLEQLRELVQLAAKQKVTPPPITHVPLEETSNVLAKLKAGTYKGRGIINYSL